MSKIISILIKSIRGVAEGYGFFFLFINIFGVNRNGERVIFWIWNSLIQKNGLLLAMCVIVLTLMVGYMYKNTLDG